MTLRDFALLADENIRTPVIEYLRDEGFDVLDVKESPLIGSSDTLLIEHALSNNLVIVTHDPDFRAVAAAGFQPYLGIVFLRPGHIDPRLMIESLRALLTEAIDLNPPFVIVVSNRESTIRIRVRQSNCGPS